MVEMSTRDIVYISAEAVIGAITVVGNSIVLIVICRTKRLHTITNVFISNLALADLAVGVFVAPCAALSFLGLPRNKMGCIFINCAILMFTNISILVLLTIAMERFVAIRFPFVYDKHMTTKLAMKLSVASWIVGSLLGLLPMYGWNIAPDNISFCAFTSVISMEYMVYFQFFGFVIVPLVLMLITYLYILYIVIKQSKRQRTVSNLFTESNAGTRRRAKWRKEVEAVKMFASLFFLFALFWLPVNILNSITLFCPSCSTPLEVLLVAIVFSHANSSVNPFLYAASNSRIRTAIKILFRMRVSPQELSDSLEVQSMASRRCSAVGAKWLSQVKKVKCCECRLKPKPASRSDMSLSHNGTRENGCTTPGISTGSGTKAVQWHTSRVDSHELDADKKGESRTQIHRLKQQPNNRSLTPVDNEMPVGVVDQEVADSNQKLAEERNDLSADNGDQRSVDKFYHPNNNATSNKKDRRKQQNTQLHGILKNGKTVSDISSEPFVVAVQSNAHINPAFVDDDVQLETSADKKIAPQDPNKSDVTVSQDPNNCDVNVSRDPNDCDVSVTHDSNNCDGCVNQDPNNCDVSVTQDSSNCDVISNQPIVISSRNSTSSKPIDTDPLTHRHKISQNPTSPLSESTNPDLDRVRGNGLDSPTEVLRYIPTTDAGINNSQVTPSGKLPDHRWAFPSLPEENFKTRPPPVMESEMENVIMSVKQLRESEVTNAAVLYSEPILDERGILCNSSSEQTKL